MGPGLGGFLAIVLAIIFTTLVVLQNAYQVGGGRLAPYAYHRTPAICQGINILRFERAREGGQVCLYSIRLHRILAKGQHLTYLHSG